MSTPNLNLPKISGNMAADIVRDMNALADAVDQNAAKASLLASHIAEDAEDAHNAASISVADVDNKFTGTNVESVLNELFTSVDNIKKNPGALSANGQLHVPNQSFIKLGTDVVQAISSGVDTKLTPVERTDRRNEFDNTNKRFTPLENGLYLFAGKLAFSAPASAYIYFKIYRNGALYDTIYAGYNERVAQINDIFFLFQTGGDYYEFYVNHTTVGGALNTETQLEITKLS